ncbi:retinol dehydrogenase [Reticulibacter mediterranei]|uniref:Retinol dehydrogenase n=2 Tax=Reticulibacter mediterranei TaxID=2778369 RepID=A0A8J3IJD2_9CHLR|nr:retinol dehydrogenase [Reticulibacter mediterranei]
MQGKICLITGANSGVGKATALGLARMGATVVMVCRSQAKGEETQKEVQAQSGTGNVHLLLADLSSQQSIRELVAQFQQQFSQLHVLINNAGMLPLGRRETVDGLEMTFAVNYLAPFLLTNLLLDTLKASAPARIINVSSDAHEAGYINMDDLQAKNGFSFMKVYGQSKLALVLFTYELARRLEGTGITVNALHPGFVTTNLGQNDIGPFLRAIARVVFLFGISPEKGASTSLYLASSSDVANVTGKYFEKSQSHPSAPISYDEALQHRLWEESIKLTHVS